MDEIIPLGVDNCILPSVLYKSALSSKLQIRWQLISEEAGLQTKNSKRSDMLCQGQDGEGADFGVLLCDILLSTLWQGP